MRFMACVVAALLCTTGLSQVDKSNALTLNSLAEVANTEYGYNEVADFESEQVEGMDWDMVDAVPALPPPKAPAKPAPLKTAWNADYVTTGGQRLHISVPKNSVAELASTLQKADPKLQKAEAIGIVNKLNFCPSNNPLVGAAPNGCIPKAGDEVTAWALQVKNVPVFDQKKAPKLKNPTNWFVVRSGTSVVQFDWDAKESIQAIKSRIGSLLKRNAATFHVYDARTNRICHPTETITACGIKLHDSIDVQFLDEKYYSTNPTKTKDAFIEENQDDEQDEQEFELVEEEGEVQVDDEDSTELVDEVEDEDEDVDEDENAPVKKTKTPPKKQAPKHKKPASKTAPKKPAPKKHGPTKKVKKDKLIKKIKPLKKDTKPAALPKKVFVEEEDQVDVVDEQQVQQYYDDDYDESAYIEQELEQEDSEDISPFAIPPKNSKPAPKGQGKNPHAPSKNSKPAPKGQGKNPHAPSKGKPKGPHAPSSHGKPQANPNAAGHNDQKLKPKQSKDAKPHH